MKTKTMPEQIVKQTPPYLPYKTFRNFIDGLRVGIPGRIDRSVIPSLSGVTQSMLIGALRYFNLTNSDGRPTELLGGLVSAEPVDRQRLLQNLLRTGYPFMFSGTINLENATTKEVQEAFAGAGVSGDTVRKAVAFFLAAAQDADIPLSQYIKVRRLVTVLAKRRGGTKRAERAGREEGRPETGLRVQTNSQKTPYEMLIEILEPESMDEEEQKAVWTLIRYLKKREGEGER